MTASIWVLMISVVGVILAGGLYLVGRTIKDKSEQLRRDEKIQEKQKPGNSMDDWIFEKADMDYSDAANWRCYHGSRSWERWQSFFAYNKLTFQKRVLCVRRELSMQDHLLRLSMLADGDDAWEEKYGVDTIAYLQIDGSLKLRGYEYGFGLHDLAHDCCVWLEVDSIDSWRIEKEEEEEAERRRIEDIKLRTAEELDILRRVNEEMTALNLPLRGRDA